ncbi:MAG: response regulator transcription factor [Oscillospiraceae bacterium]
MSTGQNILIVEDDTDINNLLHEFLTKSGYYCTQAFSGTEGLLHFETTQFALVILDIMLPGMNGGEVLSRMKSLRNVPVIVLSAIGEPDRKVQLLTAGAEDYITKPFDLKELAARVQVQLRRFAGASERDVISYGVLRLDKASFRVLIGGVRIALTKQEFKILELLMLHPAQVFSKQEIYNYAWDDFYIGEDKTVNVHISNIRKKIKAVTEQEFIETIWGIGFRMKQHL